MVLLRGQAGAARAICLAHVDQHAGAWAVLMPAKLWEGTRGEQALRRFALLVIGLVFGAAAFGLDRLLLVNLPFEMHAAVEERSRAGQLL